MTRSRETLFLRTLLCCLLGLAAAGVVQIGFEIYAAEHGITSSSFYPIVLAMEQRNHSPAEADLVEHFPAAIPAGATDAHFVYWRPLTQVILQLQCKLPESRIAELISQIRPQAQFEAPAGTYDFLEQAWSLGYYQLWNPVIRNAANTEALRLSSDYTIYLLGHEYRDGLAHSPWIYEYGVAIDPQNNDVIYWMNGQEY